ncbi:MAG: hypothetical protein ABSH41_05735 [Syntrophobacteraceae bacterium]
MKNVLIVVLISIFVIGCAPTKWVNYRDPTRDFELDKAQCAYEVQMNYQPQSTQPTDNSTGAVIGAALGDSIANGLRQAQLMELCMEARGWSKELIEKNPTSTYTPVSAVKPVKLDPYTGKVWNRDSAMTECTRMYDHGELRPDVTIQDCIEHLMAQ